jgi:hypothetical protein
MKQYEILRLRELYYTRRNKHHGWINFI